MGRSSNHPRSLSRREMLAATGALVGGAALAPLPTKAEKSTDAVEQFSYCLNTSTISGQKLSIVEEIDLIAEAGYDAVEPWIREIEAYASAGGDLAELKKRIEDKGLTVESAIGFAQWIVDDEDARRRGFEHAKRDMELLAAIGGKRIAAPPVGATNEPGLNLFKAAERYRELCELGEQTGVVPQVEVWGFSQNLSRLGESMFVAIESGHPDACLLGDVYHIYKGGSDFGGLRMISPHALQVMHMNDYPASPPRSEINDGARVFPGDGVAPLDEILRTIVSVGAHPVLSLELFNREYWSRPAMDVAKEGLDKMKAAVESALS